DSFIVTVDSASQVVEACLTNKPVHIFEWPPRPRRRLRMEGILWRRLERHKNHTNGRGRSEPQDGLSRFYDQLVYWGLIRPTRDFAAYLHALKAQGLVIRLGEPEGSTPRRPLDDMERAVVYVRQLFADSEQRQ